MATTTAADELLEWSGKLDAWQRDGLRRCASAPAIGGADIDDLLAMIKHDAGFVLATPTPLPRLWTLRMLGGAEPRQRLQSRPSGTSRTSTSLHPPQA
jgi:hypothetical protein